MECGGWESWERGIDGLLSRIGRRHWRYTGARGRRCGGGAAGGRPRRLTSNKIGQPAEGRKRVRRALRDRRVRDLGRRWGSPRGRTGSGLAGLKIGCPARLT